MVRDPERAIFIQMAFELFATGQETVASLRGKLTGAGVLMPATTRHPSRPISVERLRQLLRDRETGLGDYELIPAGPGQLGDYLKRLEAALHKENLPMHSLVREKDRIKIQLMTDPSAKTPEVSPFALLNWTTDLAEVAQDESLSRRITSSREQRGERRWEYRVSPSRFPLPDPDCTIRVRTDIIIPDEDIPEVVRRLEARHLTA